MAAFGSDNRERQRETDALIRKQAIESFRLHSQRLDLLRPWRKPKKPPQPKKITVGLPDQPGGLRAVTVDGKLVGRAQRVPKGATFWKDDQWAFGVVGATSNELDFFETLGEVREHAAALTWGVA